MAKTDPLNPSNPAATSDPKLGDDYIRALTRGTAEVLNVDHYMGANGASGYDEDDAGEHEKVTFNAPLDDHPTEEEDKAHIYIKDVDDVAELFFQDENGKSVQLTKYLAGLTSKIQSLNLDLGVLSNDTYLQAIDGDGTAKADIIKIGRNEADDADAVCLPDIARLATNAAPTEDTQLANKKYVDESIPPYLKFSHTTAAGVSGGTATSGSYETRPINTEDSDVDEMGSLSSNRIVLEEGTYECSIIVRANYVNKFVARLRNVTADETVLVGMGGKATDFAISATGKSIIKGKFTIAESQSLEVQTRCQTTRASNGFGEAFNYGESEVYLIAEFWKVA